MYNVHLNHTYNYVSITKNFKNEILDVKTYHHFMASPRGKAMDGHTA
jgi:hypothetical protein